MGELSRGVLGWTGGGTGSLVGSVLMGAVFIGHTVPVPRRCVYSQRSCVPSTGCHDQHVEIQSEEDRERER